MRIRMGGRSARRAAIQAACPFYNAWSFITAVFLTGNKVVPRFLPNNIFLLFKWCILYHACDSSTDTQLGYDRIYDKVLNTTRQIRRRNYVEMELTGLRKILMTLM